MTSFTQPVDILADQDVGLAFAAVDQSWTIAAGVLVASAKADGVASQFAQSELINDGNVFSDARSGEGVFMGGDGSSVTNATGAMVIGADDGIAMTGKDAAIDNHGSIQGLGEVGVFFFSITDSHNFSLTNSGSIFGRQVGVEVGTNGNNGAIHNSGSITSDKLGIDVSLAQGPGAIIDNAAGGTIRGDSDAIFVGAGRVSLHNHGLIVGDVTSDTREPENDVVANHGKITGAVFLGTGDDVFDGRGGTSGTVFGDFGNDRLTGGSKADNLEGGFDNDRLFGGAGNDKLDGGPGQDTLTGGPGRDQFIFGVASAVVVDFSATPFDLRAIIDRITDFTPNVDKIALSDEILTGLGPHGTLTAGRFHIGAGAADASDRIIYNPASGALIYDADGNGPSNRSFQFATLAPHLDLHHTDFLVIG
jgi:serralysin